MTSPYLCFITIPHIHINTFKYPFDITNYTFDIIIIHSKTLLIVYYIFSHSDAYNRYICTYKCNVDIFSCSEASYTYIYIFKYIFIKLTLLMTDLKTSFYPLARYIHHIHTVTYKCHFDPFPYSEVPYTYIYI